MMIMHRYRFRFVSKTFKSRLSIVGAFTLGVLLALAAVALTNTRSAASASTSAIADANCTDTCAHCGGSRQGAQHVNGIVDNNTATRMHDLLALDTTDAIPAEVRLSSS